MTSKMITKTKKNRSQATVWIKSKKSTKNSGKLTFFLKAAHAIHPRRRSPNTLFHVWSSTAKSKKHKARGLLKPSQKSLKWCQNGYRNPPRNCLETRRVKKHKIEPKCTKNAPPLDPGPGGNNSLFRSLFGPRAHLGPPWAQNAPRVLPREP